MAKLPADPHDEPIDGEMTKQERRDKRQLIAHLDPVPKIGRALILAAP